MKKLILAVSTGLFLGYSPKAPGTVGTLLGVLLVILIPLNLLTLTGFIVLGIVAASLGEKILGKKDSQEIVIDEIVGYMVAMYLIPINAVTLTLAFILFRYFDIVKPGPINKLQNIHGGLGIMLDDLAAGLVVNVILQILLRINLF